MSVFPMGSGGIFFALLEDWSTRLESPLKEVRESDSQIEPKNRRKAIFLKIIFSKNQPLDPARG